METLVIETRNKSDARFLRNFAKRMGANVIDADENFDSIVTRRLFEEELVDDDAHARKAVAAIKDFARNRGLSLNTVGVDDLLEEYEDMVLGRMMDEAMLDPANSESVDEGVIMEFLRSR